MRILESEEIQTVSGGRLIDINSTDFNLAVTGALSQLVNLVVQPVGMFVPWSPGEGMRMTGGVSGEREES